MFQGEELTIYELGLNFCILFNSKMVVNVILLLVTATIA